MKTRLITVALLTLFMAVTTHADTREVSTKSAAKQSAVFIGSAVAGAVLAGPIGYLAGGLTGAWLANNIDRADERDRSVAELADTRRELESLSTDLAHADAETGELETALRASQQSMDRYRRLASQYVTFELLFHTGESSLTPDVDTRLGQLAMFLAEQPEIDVMLSGYADPRGDDEFNLELSEQRVRSVADSLQASGVGPERITINAYGDRQSSAVDGDLDAYALERRVTIELSVPAYSAEVASLAE